MITVEFTEQEIVALRQLLHRAVLHSGMDVAEAAVMLTQKLVAAMQLTPQKLNGKSDSKEDDAA